MSAFTLEQNKSIKIGQRIVIANYGFEWLKISPVLYLYVGAGERMSLNTTKKVHHFRELFNFEEWDIL